jgi:hypothetical protein
MLPERWVAEARKTAVLTGRPDLLRHLARHVQRERRRTDDGQHGAGAVDRLGHLGQLAQVAHQGGVQVVAVVGRQQVGRQTEPGQLAERSGRCLRTGPARRR